jgi:Ala-tRNA(Pro) deacylase
VTDANPDLLARVLAQLAAVDAQVDHRRHDAATTTAALAQARGLPVSAGVKALVLKVKGSLTVLALRADRNMDNRHVRRVLRAQKLRFARAEELAFLGLRPGQVPPFGEPVLPLRLVADQAILADPLVAFTAGTWTDSLVMPTTDWVRAAAPELLPLT